MSYRQESERKLSMLTQNLLKNNKRFYLLVVGCLELEELGCVVDEGEDDDGYYVTTSLADVPLHSNVCQRMDLNCKILWEEKVFQKTLVTFFRQH